MTDKIRNILFVGLLGLSLLGVVLSSFSLARTKTIESEVMKEVSVGTVAPPKDDRYIEEMSPDEVISTFPFYRGYDQRFDGTAMPDDTFGATPFRPSFFKTRLARALTEGVDTNLIYVTTLATADSSTITTGTIGDFITIVINPNSSAGREIVSCTGTDTTNTAFSGCSRGYTFFDNTTTTSRMVPHAPGELIIISNDDLFQTTQYARLDTIQTFTGRATFATSSGVRIGDGTTSYDKFLYASNGETNLPFFSFDEDGGADATGCWAFSNNGVSSQCTTQASSTYTGTNGIDINASGGIGIRRTATTTSGLGFTGASTSTMEVFVNGEFYRDVFAARINASSTYWENSARNILAFMDTSGNLSASGTVSLFIGSTTSTVNNLRPNNNALANLGTYDNAWRDIYASGTVFADGITVSGTSSTSTFSNLVVNNNFSSFIWQPAATSTSATGTLRGNVFIEGSIDGTGTNYFGSTYAIGTFTRDLTAVDGAVVYTHGLGVVPKYIDIVCTGAFSDTFIQSNGRATGAANEHSVIAFKEGDTGVAGNCTDPGDIISIPDTGANCNTTNANGEQGNISAITSTEFTITYTQTDAITDTIQCSFEVSR